MQPLESSITQDNTFLTLQLTATSNTSSASIIILLEIIKNDTVTPIFEERIYTGRYDPETGLDIPAITLYQGYDDAVSFYIEGGKSRLIPPRMRLYLLGDPTSKPSILIQRTNDPILIRCAIIQLSCAGKS